MLADTKVSPKHATPECRYEAALIPALRYWVEDGVSFYRMVVSVACFQHDDQNSVGGDQRFLNRAEARTVNNRINNHANNAQQEQPDGILPSV